MYAPTPNVNARVFFYKYTSIYAPWCVYTFVLFSKTKIKWSYKVRKKKKTVLILFNLQVLIKD